jgi:hypothetical protein
MSKLYITKERLRQLINNAADEQADYPKPIFSLLVIFLTTLVIITIFVLGLVLLLCAVLYVLVGWIDIIIGKHIIKRIFK